MTRIMQEYCKPFQYTEDFKEDHRDIENFKPATEKNQPTKKVIATVLDQS